MQLSGQSQQRLGTTFFPINDNLETAVNAAVQGGGEINGFGKVTTMRRYNNTTLFACSSSGGIYKSNDNGANWHSLTGSFLPGVQMGCIAISPVDSNTLYAGTGEPDYAEAYGWGGYGVFKSTDGGAHWAHANTNMGNIVITDLLINNSNPSKILACASNGIYLSTNAGNTWTRAIFSGTYVQQLAQRGNSDTVFAISDNRLFVSTDWGTTWQQRTLDASSTYINGRVAVAPSNDNIVYATYIISSTWGNETQAEVFQSIDGGVTFTKVYNQNSLPALSSYDGTITGGGYGFANYCLVVSPTDPNTIYTGAHLIFASTDGGQSFNQVLANWYCCMHTDIHQLAFDPNNNNTLFAATDGGIFVSNDVGTDWQPSSDGLDCTQFFSFGQSNTDSTFVIGGTQDNGSLYLNTDGNVHTYCGGDYSDFILCDYFNPHNSYSSYNGGTVFDPYNRANSAPLNLPGPFINIKDPNLVFSPLHASTAYCYLTDVWVSNNFDQYNMNSTGGNSTISWTQITGFAAQTALALAISPINDNLIYFITDSGMLYTCRLNNGVVQSLTGQSLPYYATVSASIAISTLNPNVIYITCNNKVFRSANAGANWTDITGILPSINFQNVFIDPYSTIEALYLVTDVGIYYNAFTMSGWTSMNTGFPSNLQNTTANFYRVIAGAGLFKGSRSATSHLAMSTWGAGFQQASFYNQKCDALTNNLQLIDFGSSFNTSTVCFDNTFTGTGGSASVTVNTNGATIGATNDQFSMVGNQLVHDGSITCALISVAQGDTTQPCETGLMIRALGNNTGAPFAMIGVNGNGHVFTRYRATTGAGAINSYVSTPAVPYPDSLRLIRHGDTISLFGNFDTTGAWINYGQVVITLGDTILAGVAASSGNAGLINHSAFSLPSLTGFTELNTGIESIADNTIKLYPDPAHDFITLDITINAPVQYTVTDMLGRNVISGNVAENTGTQRIDVSALATGYYLVNVIDKQQNGLGKAKFIKD